MVGNVVVDLVEKIGKVVEVVNVVVGGGGHRGCGACSSGGIHFCARLVRLAQKQTR